MRTGRIGRTGRTERRRIYTGGMAYVGLTMTPEMKRAVEAIADEREMSTSALIRGIVKNYLQAREKAAADASRAQQNSVPLSQPRAAAGGAR